MSSNAHQTPMPIPLPLPTLGQLEEFHKLIDSVRAIDVPLDCDATTLSKSKQFVRERIERRETHSGSGVSNQATAWSSGLPDSYAEALAVFLSGGDAALVLDRLTIRSRTEYQLTSVVRSSWIYLAVMILLAAGGIAIYGEFSVPAISSMRTDMHLIPHHKLRPEPAWFTYVWAIVIALVWLAIGLIIASTLTRFPAWSASWFGGDRYRRLRMQMIRSRVLNSMNVTVKEIGDEGASETLNRGALQNRAVAQLSRMRVLIPIFLIVIVGGLGVMVYCWMLFTPLLALIYDLTTTGIGEGVVQ